ncbi:MAG: hypothetical protein ACI8RZ_002326 [Myxococcota bacterium]|jgi:hypothetical protein
MRPVFLILLAGCGSANLTGVWSGECAFEDYDMLLDLDLTQSAELLDGTAEASFSWQGYDFDFSGTATGSESEDAVALTLALGDGGTVSLDMDVASPNRIEGSCAGDGGISGGGWLER